MKTISRTLLLAMAGKGDERRMNNT